MTDTDRTIIADNPREELSHRLEWAEQQRGGAAQDGVTVDVAYFEAYENVLTDYLDTLTQSGLSEDELLDTHEIARDKWEEIDEKTEDNVVHAARADATKHILEAFFGHGTVELGDTQMATVYDDGTVRFVGEDGTPVTMTVQNEGDALAKADLFLRQADHSVDKLQQRNGVVR